MVIPVYKGVAETEACLRSVLSNVSAVRSRIVVVNDCSPEPQLTEHLRRLAGDGRITLIENSTQSRFRGIGECRHARERSRCGSAEQRYRRLRQLARPAVRVRLRRGADRRPSRRSPTTLRFAAIPTFCVDNHLSSATNLAALDAVFAAVNRGRSVQIPTAVGFCMYIRRDALTEAGLFDVEAFGKGYGEENDFCMRTAAHGWKHKLACDVFVYHAGSVSFSSPSARQEAAMRTMIARYPSYPDLVRRHVEADPAKAFRIAVTAQRIRNSGKRVFLSVIHGLGGGVAQYAGHLAELTGGAIWLKLAADLATLGGSGMPRRGLPVFALAGRHP